MPRRSGASRIPDRKQETVKSLTRKLGDSRALILADFRGMTVKEITILRRELLKLEGELHVVKNRLLLKAVSGKPDELAKLCEGPVVALFGKGDPFGLLRILFEFVKQNEKPMVKGGVLEKEFFGSAALAQIAKLPSREVLLSQVASGILSPLSQFAYVLNGLIQKLVILLSEIQKLEGAKVPSSEGGV